MHTCVNPAQLLQVHLVSRGQESHTRDSGPREALNAEKKFIEELSNLGGVFSWTGNIILWRVNYLARSKVVYNNGVSRSRSYLPRVCKLHT